MRPLRYTLIIIGVELDPLDCNYLHGPMSDQVTTLCGGGLVADAADCLVNLALAWDSRRLTWRVRFQGIWPCRRFLLREPLAQ